MSSSTRTYAIVSDEQLGEDSGGSEENLCNEISVHCRDVTDSQISNVNLTATAQDSNGISLHELPSDHTEEVEQANCEDREDVVRKEEFNDKGNICDHDKELTDSGSATPECEQFSSGATQEASFPDTSALDDPSNKLLNTNHSTEHSTEEGDEVFPLAPHKTNSSSTDDLLDKNFVKWTNSGNSTRSSRGKDSSESESPSSEFEFSACSSVTSCTEDSGISSTVRDDELEEIPLNSSQFSPELYKQMSSKFSVDEMVASWVPQSSNTYAPSPNSNVKAVAATDGRKSGGNPQKQSKLKGLFTKSTQKQPVPSWKLFGKVPAKDPTDVNQETQTKPSPFDRGDVKRKSVGDKPSVTTPSSRPKFLSMKKKPALGSSTTALIFENRPRNLPAKSPTEEKKHRRQYEAMVAEARKKELKDMKLQEKKQKEKCRQEDGIASAASVWTAEILPNWETMRFNKKTRELWWQGLPPSVRGKVWKLAIGNDLHITQELFDIFQSHAYDKLFTTRLNKKKKSPTQSVAELPSSDHTVVSKAHTVELIMMDVSRTFPSLCIFQEGGPFHDVLHSILGAYTCYRPDVGYVQGMSFLAAVLLLNMEPSDAFICFANLLNKPCQHAFFRVDHPMMIAYFAAFEMFLEEFLPVIHAHFIEENFTPDMYLIDWTFTLFSKSLPLDVASRVWDVFCRDGEAFLFRAALGILKFYSEDLLEMDFIHLGQFLSKLPDDIPATSLFQSIASINLIEQKFSQTLALQKEVAAQIKSVTSPTK